MERRMDYKWKKGKNLLLQTPTKSVRSSTQFCSAKAKPSVWVMLRTKRSTLRTTSTPHRCKKYLDQEPTSRKASWEWKGWRCPWRAGSKSPTLRPETTHLPVPTHPSMYWLKQASTLLLLLDLEADATLLAVSEEINFQRLEIHRDQELTRFRVHSTDSRDYLQRNICYWRKKEDCMQILRRTSYQTSNSWNEHSNIYV